MARILFICDTFPPNIGGSESTMVEMARAAQLAGHSVTVFIPRSKLSRAAEKEFDQGENYQVIRSATWLRLFELGGSRNAIISRLARAAIIFYVFFKIVRMPAEVLVAGHVLPLGNVALSIKRMRGTPVIVFTYGEDVTVYSRGGRMRQMLISVLQNADVVTCTTSNSADEIRRLSGIPESKIALLPPHADTGLVQANESAVQTLREKYALHDKLVLLTVARLVPRKGIDITLQAVASLRQDFPALRYFIVGDGPDRERLKQLITELQLDDIVIFTGPVASTHPYFHLCTIFVMPNRMMEDGEREGYGVVFVEAGLAGKPVIGGRSGGAVDAIVNGETGILVTPEDPNELAAAITQLLLNADVAKKMGVAGRERALALNSPQAARADFVRVLEPFVADPASKNP